MPIETRILLDIALAVFIVPCAVVAGAVISGVLWVSFARWMKLPPSQRKP